MKKLLLCSLLALVLFCSVSKTHAASNPLTQLTGQVWMASEDDNKEAIIFGIEYAVSIEYAIAELEAKKAGTSMQREVIIESLSPLAKNWILAFDDGTSRDAIVNEINAWYAAHEDALSLPVVKVLWDYVIEPRLPE